MWTSLREKTSGGPVIGGPSHFCEFYFQELYQVPTMSIREKCPYASSRGRGKVTSKKYAKAFCSSFNWHVIETQHYISFRCTAILLWNDHHSKSSSHPSPHIVTNIFLVMRTFEIYSLSNFQIYNTLLLTTVCPHDLLTGGSLYLLTTFIYFTQPPPMYSLATTNLFSVFMSLFIHFLDSTYKWHHMVCVFLCLTYFT